MYKQSQEVVCSYSYMMSSLHALPGLLVKMCLHKVRVHAELYSKFSARPDRKRPTYCSMQEACEGNVNASKLYTFKDDKHREDSAAVVKGEQTVWVTELS